MLTHPITVLLMLTGASLTSSRPERARLTVKRFDADTTRPTPGLFAGLIFSPRLFNQTRIARSICAATGIPSRAFTSRITSSNSGASRTVVISL